ALWLAKELNQKIATRLSDALLSNCGALVFFLAHFPQHKPAADKKLYERLRGVIEGAGKYWPLTLELVHLNEGDPAWTNVATPSALRGLHDAAQTLSAVVTAVAVGELTPADAGEISRLIEAYVKAFETAELAERVERLERMTSQ